jgi:hypothetical protein
MIPAALAIREMSHGCSSRQARRLLKRVVQHCLQADAQKTPMSTARLGQRRDLERNDASC